MSVLVALLKTVQLIAARISQIISMHDCVQRTLHPFTRICSLQFFVSIHLHLVVGNGVNSVTNVAAYQSQHDVLNLSAELLNSRSFYGFSSTSSWLLQYTRLFFGAQRLFVFSSAVLPHAFTLLLSMYKLYLLLHFCYTRCKIFQPSTSSSVHKYIQFLLCTFFLVLFSTSSLISLAFVAISILSFSHGFGFGSHQFFKLYA